MSEFPEDIRRLLLESITSVDQLEVLLLLRAHPEREWDPEQVSRELYTRPAAAAMRLADLHALRLVDLADRGKNLYRYRPGTPEQAGVVDRLAEVYKERRVAVITLIYSKPLSQVQSFADAFRLRKEKEE
jgi:hypothetical protein